jgi:beta-glucosidase
MTLEEKASLCSGEGLWHTKAIPRLDIPNLMLSDGPYGLRTQTEGLAKPNESVPAVCFPASCAAASSFDAELIRHEGEELGTECRSLGVSVLLGPAVNLKRSPLCGRNFEYYSEDPYLAGQMAAAYIDGLQSRGVGAALKHFAANNQEYHRLTASSEVDERTLRELYLPAFEAAVKAAGPWTVMCSYNRVNGVYASENKRLLTDILRGEWGFDGFVMSDWGAVNDRVKGVAAGLDLEMPGNGGENDAKIVAAVRSGKLDETLVDRAAARILNIVFRAADLAQETEPPLAFDYAGGHAFAVQMEKECAVLLKNKGVLPLRKRQKIVYIGGFAEQPRYQGGGSSHINTQQVYSALDAARSNGRNVEYVRGFPSDFDEREEAEFMRAVEAARRADAAVIFAGLPDSFESEGYDRKSMSLPDCQNNLIARVAAIQPNTVVVLHSGSPVECPWVEDVAAVLTMYLGGEGVGEAEDALLYGDANPCGRLAETWPLRLQDTPSYLEFPGNGRTVHYTEGIYVGYRWYDARQMPVLWPFGHGLSYTGFVYHNAQLSAPVMEENGSVTVSVAVKNTGERAGREVVQLYVADRTGTPGRPPKELKGFAKLELQPEEEKTVSFALDAHSLAYYEPALGDWYAPAGKYAVLLGHSSRDIHSTLELEYHTSRTLPVTIDANTVLADLMQDARTRSLISPVAAQYLNAFREAAAPDHLTADEEDRNTLENTPLRCLLGFGGMTAQQLENLIEQLRRARKE